jgi:hypothetical protein
MSSGLPIFEGLVRRPALRDCHREMGFSEVNVGVLGKCAAADSDVKLVR